MPCVGPMTDQNKREESECSLNTELFRFRNAYNSGRRAEYLDAWNIPTDRPYRPIASGTMI